MNNTLTLNPSFILKRGFTLKWPITLRLFWILSILSIAALLVFYIFQVNAEASERYLIQNYNTKLSEISKENQALEISSFQINSLDKIVELLEPLNFEKTGKIHYIRALNKQVVAK